VRDRDGSTIFAYCLMSNHYHLAVRVGPVPLSRSIGFVQSRFGQGYNRRHCSTGPLWQSRFKAKIVEDEGYLLQLVAYTRSGAWRFGSGTRPAPMVVPAGECRRVDVRPWNQSKDGRAENRGGPAIRTECAAFAAFGVKMVGTRRFELRTP